jgi:hypothetical protein
VTGFCRVQTAHSIRVDGVAVLRFPSEVPDGAGLICRLINGPFLSRSLRLLALSIDSGWFRIVLVFSMPCR